MQSIAEQWSVLSWVMKIVFHAQQLVFISFEGLQISSCIWREFAFGAGLSLIYSSCNFDPEPLLCKSLDGISLWSLVFECSGLQATFLAFCLYPGSLTSLHPRQSPSRVGDTVFDPCTLLTFLHQTFSYVARKRADK